MSSGIIVGLVLIALTLWITTFALAMTLYESSAKKDMLENPEDWTEEELSRYGLGKDAG